MQLMLHAPCICCFDMVFRDSLSLQQHLPASPVLQAHDDLPIFQFKILAPDGPVAPFVDANQWRSCCSIDGFDTLNTSILLINIKYNLCDAAFLFPFLFLRVPHKVCTVSCAKHR